MYGDPPANKVSSDVPFLAGPPPCLAVDNAGLVDQLVPSYPKVVVKADPSFPPKIIPAVRTPDPPCAFPEYGRFDTEVQDEPSHSSTSFDCAPPGGLFPPTATAAVEVPKAPITKVLAVFADGVAVQAEPFQLSLEVVSAGPEAFPKKPNAAVCVPAPPKALLAVFKLPTSVKEDQS